MGESQPGGRFFSTAAVISNIIAGLGMKLQQPSGNTKQDFANITAYVLELDDSHKHFSTSGLKSIQTYLDSYADIYLNIDIGDNEVYKLFAAQDLATPTGFIDKKYILFELQALIYHRQHDSPGEQHASKQAFGLMPNYNRPISRLVQDWARINDTKQYRRPVKTWQAVLLTITSLVLAAELNLHVITVNFGNIGGVVIDFLLIVYWVELWRLTRYQKIQSKIPLHKLITTF